VAAVPALPRMDAKLLANVDMFLAQTAEDAMRLQDIGASPEPRAVSGNLKFDIPGARFLLRLWRLCGVDCWGGARPVLVCGIRVDGEESLLLKAFENILVQHPRAAMILARGIRNGSRPWWLCWSRCRFATAGDLLEWRVFAGGVFLLDTIGELARVVCAGRCRICRWKPWFHAGDTTY